ncbi:MAG: DUF4244 domain-containing protein [Actinomycetaceae bacterium]|nr:DUF4244 domain-containing protein [Actinomycetaceae bacterium]
MNTEVIESETTNGRGIAESGMVSAEYAVGTVATTGIAGLLVWLSQQEWFREGIASIFRMIFQF